MKVSLRWYYRATGAQEQHHVLALLVMIYHVATKSRLLVRIVNLVAREPI
jgi:hypothetical protein